LARDWHWQESLQDKEEMGHATTGFGEWVVTDKQRIHLRGFLQGVGFRDDDDLT